MPPALLTWVYSKRTGLAKAVHRIEQALHKAATDGGQIEDPQAALQLQQLLNKSSSILPRNAAVEPQRTRGQTQINMNPVTTLHGDAFTPSSNGTDISAAGGTDDGLSLDDAENPLQLLARASNLTDNIPQPSSSHSHTRHHTSSHIDLSRYKSSYDDLRTFFGSPGARLDVSEELDPIELGFIEPHDTDALFTLYVTPHLCNCTSLTILP
jgi:hypothetical protein